MTRFIPGPDTVHAFRTALGRFATGVAVVTCRTERGPVGITANSFSSVSLHPPLILWSPAKSSSRHDLFVEAEHFTVHILEAAQRDVCRQFTKEGWNFEGLDMSEGEGGAPVIGGCLAHFECSRYAAHDAGDHTIILGQVEAAIAREGQPLIFSSGALGGFAG